MAKNWLGLFALMPALAMTFMDQSVLPVALPTIQRELNASSTQLIWAVNCYLLAITIFVIACGKLSDWMGHRRAFCLGILTFAIASAMSSLSMDGGFLIAARTLQGLGAAFMIPSSNAIMMTLFSREHRGKAIGINVSCGSIFLILGPLVGGYLTETYSWRWIFWINLPLAGLGLLFSLLFVPPSKKKKGSLDIPGFLYYLGSAPILVILLMQGREWGWDSTEVIIPGVFFLLFALLLLDRERKATHPYLELSLFKHPFFRAVNLSICSVQFVLMITIFWAIYFQEVLGWTPINSGVAIFICSIPVLFAAPFSGFLMDRFGVRLPILIGFPLLIFSLPYIALFIHHSFWILLVGLLAFGIGISLILTPSYATAMSSIPKEKAGMAFGTIQSLRSLSSTLGVAIIGSFFDNFKSPHSILYIQIILAVLLLLAFLFVTKLYYTRHCTIF